jgi:hypothetical protein
MPATQQTNPTKAAIEAAVLDLTDEEIVNALRRFPAVRDAFKARESYTWPKEARRNLLDALAQRLARGRVPAS